MKIGVGLVVIGVGAILAFAVTASTSGFNIHTAGWIIMIVGVLGILLPARTYGWFNQRVVRRTYTTRPPQAPVQSYVAQTPGNSRLQPGLPAPRPVVEEDVIDRSYQPYQPATGVPPVPGTTEVVEDTYEEPS